jgi:sterol desaturase/sphingolipid hydroxylase (fatty acid hydroxylase superfamily)
MSEPSPALHLVELLLRSLGSAGSLATFAGLLAAGSVVLWVTRWGLSHYWNRVALTDAVYTLLYAGGIYGLLWAFVATPLESAVQRFAPFLEAGLLASAPTWLRLLAFTVVLDLLLYWKHRLMHGIPRLWRFHAIHHSQQSLTLLTSYRFHPVDELLASLVGFGLSLVIGVPPRMWLPLTFLLAVYAAVQHEDTGWTYGPFDLILVGPRFHAVHHAIEPSLRDRNYGILFSVWDRLFGTAAPGMGGFKGYGVTDLAVPESFLAQLVFPFRKAPSIAGAVEAQEAPRPDQEPATQRP